MSVRPVNEPCPKKELGDEEPSMDTSLMGIVTSVFRGVAGGEEGERRESTETQSKEEEENNIKPANFDEAALILKHQPLMKLARAHSINDYASMDRNFETESSLTSNTQKQDNEENIDTDPDLNTPSSNSPAGKALRKPVTLSQVLRIILRILYMLELMYTACVLPIIISIVDEFRHVEYTLDIVQIIYMVVKIRGKGDQTWRENLKEYVRTINVIEIVAIFPVSSFGQYYYTYGLFFLKLSRMVSFNQQFNLLFGKLLTTKQLIFWLLIIQLENLLMWAARFWLFFTTKINQRNGWHNLYCSDISESECFVDAYYFTLYTMITVGFGDLNPIVTTERIVLFIYMAGGVFLFTYYLAVISNYVEKSFFIQTETEQQNIVLSKIKRTIRHIPKSARLLKIVSNYVKKYKTVDLDNEEYIGMIKILPDHLQDEMEQYLNQKLLGDLALFRLIPGFNVMGLIHLMKELSYEPGELIVEEEQQSQDVYFIKYGRAAPMMSSKFNFKHNLCFAYFECHSCFGEYEVFPTLKPRKWSVISLSWCRLLTLSGYSLLPFIEKNQIDCVNFSGFVRDNEEKLERLERKMATQYEKTIVARDVSRRDRKSLKSQSSGSYEVSVSEVNSEEMPQKQLSKVPAQHIRELQAALQALRRCQQNLILAMKNSTNESSGDQHSF